MTTYFSCRSRKTDQNAFLKLILGPQEHVQFLATKWPIFDLFLTKNRPFCHQILAILGENVVKIGHFVLKNFTGSCGSRTSFKKAFWSVFRDLQEKSVVTKKLTLSRFSTHTNVEMDLDKLIKEQKDTLKENFPIYRVKKISKQILSGVEFLHQHRICHRDLKPQNVLLRDGVFRDILSI